jgi:hypothetical protein
MTEHLCANVVSLGTTRNRDIKTQKSQESPCVHARECQEALEQGLTSENVHQEINRSDPVVRRFLGVEANVCESVGLSNNFALNAISAVGNYSEISARNFPSIPVSFFQEPYTEGGFLFWVPFA